MPQLTADRHCSVRDPTIMASSNPSRPWYPLRAHIILHVLCHNSAGHSIVYGVFQSMTKRLR